jgi:hypothetical protein
MIDPELRDGQLLVSSRVLRQFAGLWLLLFGTLAVLQWLDGATTGATALAIVAAAVALPGLISPQSIAIVFHVAMAVAMPIGWVVSHALLALTYFAVFAPVAIVFRMFGRDALTRKRRPATTTYWTAKERPSDPDRYLRQT